MKIRKFNSFINENLQETPETLIAMSLKKLKSNIDKIFDHKDEFEKKPNKILKPEELNKKEKSFTSFKDLGVELESSEISKYSKLYDSLTVKFSDQENTYTMIIMIDIKEALPKEKDKFVTLDNIKKCYVKFKKYDINTFDIIGQISKEAEIKDIDEDFILNLKIEIDEEFGSDDEELEIETN